MLSSRTLSLLCAPLFAATFVATFAAPGSASAGDAVPVYRVTVVGRTIQAINFRDPDRHTFVDIVGTPLLAEAAGKARVQRKEGSLRLDLKLDKLVPANRFGEDYLTYVLWAITPEGRPTNLGELTLDGGEAELDTTTALQAFGLIVTAEPYFAVTQPSDVVVAEAVARPGVKGRIDAVEAHYELLKRPAYTVVAGSGHAAAHAIAENDRDVAQARNAVAIALGSGAEVHAREPFHKAQDLLRQAETADRGSKSAVMLARQATQTAEDARQIAVKQEAQARLDRERAEAVAREASARADTVSAEKRAAVAQANTLDADKRTAEARADAERSEQSATIARADASAQVAEANRAVALAETEKATFRAQLLQQLSVILETRETARGLLVNVPDVSFDVDRATLRPEAREKLARLAGVILSHPGLDLAAEGHTDSTGTAQHNQTLSEQRAASVLDYLVAQSIPAGTIVTAGFGKNRPIASNDTAAGRQLNRRVEVIVSGAVLGVTVSVLTPPSR